MSIPADAPADFRPARALTYLGALGGMGLGLSALYAATGFGLPCPLRTLTGWSCPLCGATRMGSALLQGDLVGAFAYNPVVLVGLAVLSVLGLLWTGELLGGPRLRPSGRLGTRLRRVHPTRWLVLGMSAALVYTLARNLL